MVRDSCGKGALPEVHANYRSLLGGWLLATARECERRNLFTDQLPNRKWDISGVGRARWHVGLESDA